MPSFLRSFPSKYLKAADLERDVEVKIVKVRSEEVGPTKDPRLVAYFEGLDGSRIEKGVVLNKTRCNGIAKAAQSDDTDEWPGTTVVLYPSTTQFQGEEVECIGIRPPRSKRAVAAQAPVEPADDEGNTPF